MERKLGVRHPYVVLLQQTVNTPGTEVAPRSYVVGEHFQHHHVPPTTIDHPIGLSGLSMGARKCQISRRELRANLVSSRLNP